MTSRPRGLHSTLQPTMDTWRLYESCSGTSPTLLTWTVLMCMEGEEQREREGEESEREREEEGEREGGERFGAMMTRNNPSSL